MQNKVIISVLSGFIAVDAFLIYLALTISPIRLKRSIFVYEYGDKIPTNPDHYVNANESVLENVHLNLNAVKPEVGVYQASVTYLNDNQIFEIKIIDTKKPKVKLKKVQFNIVIGKTLKANDLIETVDDASATKTYFYDEKTGKKSTSKEYNTEGSYVERIIVEDDYGNQSAMLRVKIVVERKKKLPIIKGINDFEIKIGESFDLLKGVKAIDEYEGDISSRIVIEGYVDNQTEGVYPITYRVCDKQGNEVKVVRKVTVKK